MAVLSSILPFELVIEILLRLPVKAILRFRCVCREWRYLIDSKRFINTQLTQSVINKMNPCLVMQLEKSPCLYSVELASLEETVELDIRSWWPDDYWYACTGVKILGSCNGLLCLSSNFVHVALWNPSTKKHFFLPPWSFDDIVDEYSSLDVAFGFGFDSAADDYKVVSIGQEYEDGYEFLGTQVKVWNLASGSWRRIYGFPDGLVHEMIHGVLVRETLHWLVIAEETRCYDSIIAFDLRTEEICTILIPSNMKGFISYDFHMTILAIEGCLSASFFDKEVGLDLWVLEEYGVGESWTKLISIRDPNILAYGQLWPIPYNKNGGMLLIACFKSVSLTQVISYDFETKAIEEAPIRDLPESTFGQFFLLESLVPPDGGGC